jgi:hypothetical protein
MEVATTYGETLKVKEAIWTWQLRGEWDPHVHIGLLLTIHVYLCALRDMSSIIS